MAKLELKKIYKTYKTDKGEVEAVRDLNLSCEDGEFLAILGPSGCGKSTTLRMIAGLEDITKGELLIGGKVVNDKSSRERNIALAFETYALYPPFTVYENIAFPLRVRKLPENEIKRKVQEVVDLAEINDIVDKKPSQLSGGQMQAVGLARALVREPSVFLLDEPISHFDSRQRSRMRVRIKKLQKTLGITMVYVTHDQLEAMAMADRIAIMNFAELQQVGTPGEIYNEPVNTFVAGFIGDPPMNMIECRISSNEGEICLEGDGFKIPLSGQLQKQLSQKNLKRGHEVILGIRPHFVSVSQEKEENFIRGTVYNNEFLGEDRVFSLKIGENSSIQALVDSTLNIDEGAKVYVGIDQSKLRLFDKQTGKYLFLE